MKEATAGGEHPTQPPTPSVESVGGGGNIQKYMYVPIISSELPSLPAAVRKRTTHKGVGGARAGSGGAAAAAVRDDEFQEALGGY